MRRKRLIILGASDFSREVLWLASEIPPEQRDWEVGGFLDDALQPCRERWQKLQITLPVLQTIRDYEPEPGDAFVCAIGNPVHKLRVCEALRKKGGEFVNLVHPTVGMGEGCKLGVGVILCRYATLTVNVTLGNFVAMNCYSSAGHDADIGDGCTLSSHCDITGRVRLGRGVFAGSHAAVLPGVAVGEFATIGAGSVVVHRVAPGATVLGVPARTVFTRGQDGNESSFG